MALASLRRCWRGHMRTLVVDVKMTFVLGARKRLDDEQEKSGLGRTDEE